MPFDAAEAYAKYLEQRGKLQREETMEDIKRGQAPLIVDARGGGGWCPFFPPNPAEKKRGSAINAASK